MKKQGAGIIIQNSSGEVLLMLRDDDPSIRYPNYWYVLGGRAKEGEVPEETIKREMMEELELELKNISLFKKYDFSEETQWIFYTRLDLNPENINLHEGQKIKYFSWEEIKNMKLGFHDNSILKDFFER